MALEVLYEVPTDATSLARWSFAHMAHHRDIIRAIFEQKNKVLSEYQLDPFNPSADDFETWVYQHQIMHDQMEAVLGDALSNFDLTEIDWQDRAGLVTWINTHAIEHVQAAQILGVS